MRDRSGGGLRLGVLELELSGDRGDGAAGAIRKLRSVITVGNLVKRDLLLQCQRLTRPLLLRSVERERLSPCGCLILLKLGL